MGLLVGRVNKNADKYFKVESNVHNTRDNGAPQYTAPSLVTYCSVLLVMVTGDFTPRYHGEDCSERRLPERLGVP